MKKDKSNNNDKSEIIVKVHIPDNVPDRIKQDKINRLYDLLKPKEVLENKSA